MNISHHRTCVAGLAVVAVALMTARPVRAQQMSELNDRPERVSRALFGSGRSNVAQSLSFDGTLASGVERVLSSSTPEAVGRGSSSITSGSAGLAYGLNISHVAFGARAGSFARYSPNMAGGASVGHDASASLSSGFQLFSRVEASVDASMAYQPVSVISLFPDMFQDQSAPSILVDYQYDGPVEQYVSMSGGGGLSYALSNRSDLSFNYQYAESNGDALDGGQAYQSFSVGYSHAIARGLALRLGYGRRVGWYGPADVTNTVRNHDIDAGVDFNRSLSFSRSTTLTFSTGTTFISDGTNERYDFVGSATLAHQMGRDWSTSVSYNRDLEFVAVVAQPVFSDSMFASVEGLFGRRVSVHFGAGASLGQVGAGSNDNGYRAYQAAASLQTALSRYVGISGGYVYYDYRFDGVQSLPNVIRQADRRHTAHVSVDLFLPLFQRGTRSTNAAR